MSLPRSATTPRGEASARRAGPGRDPRQAEDRPGHRRDAGPSPRRRASRARGVTSGGGREGRPRLRRGVGAAALQAAVAERTADLQRLQAEYANYRKRVDRDRLARRRAWLSAGCWPNCCRCSTTSTGPAAHDDLTGALKAVADHLDGIFGKLGLQAFGEVGDPFDPAIHEAVLHTESDDVTAPTATTVMRKGYQHGDRLLRPAMVGVTEPARQPRTPEPPDPRRPDAPSDRSPRAGSQ